MKTRIATTLCLLLTTFIRLKAQAQESTAFNSKIPQELLQKDFRVMQDSMISIHPGLYRYHSKAKVKDLFARAYRKIDRPMTETDFFTIISKLISEIEDGRTECFLPHEFIGMIMSNIKIFPIQPRFIGDKAYAPCETKEFPAGTQIISVDGQGKRI